MKFVIPPNLAGNTGEHGAPVHVCFGTQAESSGTHFSRALIIKPGPTRQRWDLGSPERLRGNKLLCRSFS
jgi:hypothetical protein